MITLSATRILSMLPKWRAKQQWLFSVKVFGAAMLSLYMALALGLDHPYWAMATVYLVSNPLDGATRSKSAYRIAGTVLGAAAALVLVPPLVNEPLALMAAISFWTAALLYLSQMERGPRSYTFLLAAFTLPIVALPTVTDPLSCSRARKQPRATAAFTRAGDYRRARESAPRRHPYRSVTDADSPLPLALLRSVSVTWWRCAMRAAIASPKPLPCPCALSPR